MSKVAPLVLTAKQESFAQAIVEGRMNATEAYRSAYDADDMHPKHIWKEASLLMKHPKVSRRVAELRAEITKGTVYTVEKLLDELEEARVMAATCETPQASAMVSATMGKGKLLGLISDQTNIVANVMIDNSVNSMTIVNELRAKALTFDPE